MAAVLVVTEVWARNPVISIQDVGSFLFQIQESCDSYSSLFYLIWIKQTLRHGIVAAGCFSPKFEVLVEVYLPRHESTSFRRELPFIGEKIK